MKDERQMYIDEIRFALDDNSRTGLQDAFRALVGFPNSEEIDGEDLTASELWELLEHVCLEINGNFHRMNRETAEIIRDVTGQATQTYATSARVVLAHSDRWRERYLLRLGK